jgi:hypothetical protein
MSALATCPVCGELTELARQGLHWCSGCDCGWSTPREYTRRHRLRPHEARKQLVGRRPWHIGGRPVVREDEL